MAGREVIEEKANKTIYREGNTIIKAFAPNHPKADVFNEAFIQSCVEAAGLPVPKLLGVTEENGRWCLAMERIEGTDLRRIMQQDEGRLDEYLEKFVDIQIEFGAHRVPRLRNTRYKMEEIISGMRDEIDASTRYELMQRIHAMRRHTRLCHGDYVPANVILREDGSYVVLDWAHATAGNAGADAAITYMRLCLEMPAIADDYLQLYSRKADMPVQYIEKWMPIVAAAQLSKHVPEETELLTSWVSVAEYQ